MGVENEACDKKLQASAAVLGQAEVSTILKTYNTQGSAFLWARDECLACELLCERFVR